jgi:hypothetical protein
MSRFCSYSSPVASDATLANSQTERDTTEQEETLLDNDKQPWLSDIVLSPMIKKRGRPKGLTQTVLHLLQNQCFAFGKSFSLAHDKVLPF